LDETDNAQSLNWLPRNLPPYVRLVVSYIDDPAGRGQVLQAFSKRPHERIDIRPLAVDERLEIISRVPSLSAKTLDHEQKKLLLDNPATMNPLFLIVALEELRGFGSFKQLNARIRAFPKDGDTVTEIFLQVISRIEKDFGPEFVRDLLSLLACARRGLSERELKELLSTSVQSENLFPALRQLRPYMQYREEVLDFFHRSLFKAVRRRYLDAPEDRKALYGRLAVFFLSKPNFTGPSGDRVNPDLRKGDELLFHLLRGELWDELGTTIRDLDFLDARCRGKMVYDLVSELSDILNHPGLPNVMKATTEELRRFFRINIAILVEDPRLLFQRAINSTPESMIEKIALSFLNAGKQRRPWLKRLNREKKKSPLMMTLKAPPKRRKRNICFLPGDGAILYSDENQAIVWDTENGEVLNHRRSLPDIRKCSILLPEKKAILTAGENFRIDYLDPDSLDIRTTVRGDSGYQDPLAFSGDGALLATADAPGNIRVWRANSAGSEATLGFGHWAGVRRVDFSPDGQRIVSCSGEWNPGIGDLLLWDALTGELIHCFKGHENWIGDCCFFPCGTRVASCGKDGNAVIWDCEVGGPLHYLEHDGSVVYDCRVSSDGRRLITRTDDDCLRVWNCRTGQLMHRFRFNIKAGLRHVWTVDKAGRYVAATVRQGDESWLKARGEPTEICVWDTVTGEKIAELEGEEKTLLGMSFSPDGRRLAGVFIGHHVCRVWDAADGRDISTFSLRMGDNLSTCEFSRDGRRLFVSANCKDAAGKHAGRSQVMHICDPNTGRELDRFPLEHYCREILCYPDDSLLLTIGDYELTLWDLATKKPAGYEYESESGSIGVVSLSRDGSRFAVGTKDRRLRIFDGRTGKQIFCLGHGHRARAHCAAFYPGNRRLVTCGGGEYRGVGYGEVLIWDLKRPEKPVKKKSGLKRAVRHCAVTGDGGKIAVLSERGKFSIWDPEVDTLVEAEGSYEDDVFFASRTGKKFVLSCYYGRDLAVLSLEGETVSRVVIKGAHEDWIRDAALSYNEKWVVSLDEAEIKIWDLDESGRKDQDAIKDKTSFFSMSPDRRSIAWFQEDGSLVLVNAATGGRKIHNNLEFSRVYCFSFSPDGDRIAALLEGDKALIWNLETGNLENILDLDKMRARNLSFSPDGKSVLIMAYPNWKILDMQTGAVSAFEPGGKVNVSNVCYLQDGRHIVVGLETARIFLMDMLGGREIQEIHGKSDLGIEQMLLSPDGKQILFTTRGDATRLYIWETAGKKRAQCLNRAIHKIEDCDFARWGDVFCLLEKNDYITLWSSGPELFRSRFDPYSLSLNCISVSPDGKNVLSAGHDMGPVNWGKSGPKPGRQRDVIRILDSETGDVLAQIDPPEGDIWKCVYSNNGSRFITLTDTAKVSLIEADRRRVYRQNHPGRVGSLARIYESPSGKMIGEIPGALQGLRACVAVDDEDYLIALEAEMGTDLLRLGESNVRRVSKIPFSNPRVCAFSRDASRILLADGAGCFEIREAGSGICIMNHSCDNSFVGGCLDVKGERAVLFAEGGLVQLWRAGVDNSCFSLEEEGTKWIRAAFSPLDGKLLLIGERKSGQYFRMIDPENGRELLRNPAVSGKTKECFFSPDNRLFGSVTDRSLFLWERESLRPVSRFDVGNGHPGKCALSSDGTKLSMVLSKTRLIIRSFPEMEYIAEYRPGSEIQQYAWSAGNKVVTIRDTFGALHILRLEQENI